MELCLVGSPTAPNGLPSRPMAKYHPTVWDQTFSSEVSEQTLCEWREKAKALKRKVMKMLSEDEAELPNSKRNSKLHLIDAIKRLGVAYHFEQEIEKELARSFTCLHDLANTDLNTLALRFRLLREHGYNVPCDVVQKLVDKESNFNESVREDVDGLLSLYEATYLRVKGESILEDALQFTKISLESLLPRLSPFLCKQVNESLYRPVRKRLPRVEARNYMSIYEKNEQHSEVLLHFAKLDFNILQVLHQKELSIILEWWRDVDCASKFPFARDRIVEDYFWVLGVYFEPQYAMARAFLTRVIAMTSIIDDIYDSYGTKEELELFTNAVDRWEVSASVDLPEYMKTCYEQLLDVYGKAEEQLIKQGSAIFGIHAAKEAMKRLLRAYLEERKWLDRKDEIPTVEEYLKVALVSSAYPMLSVASLVCMGDVAENKQVFDWMLDRPKIVTAASTITRLMDDIVSHKFEQEREHPPSAVECYTIQYGVSEEIASDAFRVEIEEAWKDINEAFLRSTPVTKSVLMRVLNLARVMEALYKEGDGYTHVSPTVKSSITSILFTAVQL